MKFVWSKIKYYALAFWGVISFIGIALFTLFFVKKNSEEKKRLERLIDKQISYTKKKEKIENETEEKLSRLNADDRDSFNTGVELLHEASNSE